MGDQEYYFNEQDQQEHFDQGKYSMGSSLLPIHFNNQSIFACVTLIRISYNCTYALTPMGYALGSFASAQLNHDLVT